MLTRREMLIRSLQTSSLVALGTAVPGFLANTARAAEPGKDTVLVVIEMTGGNDGLNTVIPYTDELYYKARPTLAFKKDQVLRVDDQVGLFAGSRLPSRSLSCNAAAPFKVEIWRMSSGAR